MYLKLTFCHEIFKPSYNKTSFSTCIFARTLYDRCYIMPVR
jgi:hypothetical protein